jgi:UDP-N-acetylmuramoyl-L-alanyl-D-glutamate--2,6-diaminopimelate ligase
MSAPHRGTGQAAPPTAADRRARDRRRDPQRAGRRRFGPEPGPPGNLTAVPNADQSTLRQPGAPRPGAAARPAAGGPAPFWPGARPSG